MSERDEKSSEAPAQEIEGEAQVIEEAEVVEIEGEVTERGGSEAVSRRVPLLAVALSLLAISGVTGGLYFGFQYWNRLEVALVEMDQAIAAAAREQEALQQRLSDTRMAFEEQQRQMVSQESALAEQEQLFAAQTDMLAQEQARLGSREQAMREAIDAVHRKMGSSGNDWMAAEAAYLMRIANHRLYLERDVETSLRALEAADARLRDTGDPAWIGIREKLAVEIAALKAVPPVDKAGLSARLGGLAEQVYGLKLVGLTPEREAAASSGEPAPDASDKSWSSLLADGWEGFKSVMVIRHRERPVNAMMSPDQQYFVYQNLRLQFEAARLAMLRGESVLYRSSLETARRWLEEFFDPEQAAVQTLLAGLEELSRREVAPALPDITGSLRLLSERMAAKPRAGADQ